ncbi:MAG: hypothetical protein NZ602_16585 [Thermoguttaceae bacterium]|nr:hypothetical protein [Thermoguttaceae bacterium]MDW8038678.1 hypothetical protein [Thermoguttaceae bacterium]
MGTRWVNVAVVGLWLASMSWLVVEKVLPPLRVGQPPNYQTISQARRKEGPVGWRLYWNQEPIGWALSQARPQAHQSLEIRSRVHLDYIPLADLVPEWLARLFRLPEFRQLRLSLDTTSTLMIDPLGRLVRLHSSLQVGKFPEVVHMEGVAEGNDLIFTIRCGEFSYETKVPIPPDALLADSLSPQTRLPGLRLGQHWTLPTLSPLGRWNHALEILHAKVESEEPILWEGKTQQAYVVVFWPDIGTASAHHSPRGRLWVLPDPDARVVRQQVTFFHSQMEFIRMSDADSVRLASQVNLDEPLGAPRTNSAGQRSSVPLAPFIPDS